MTQICTHVCHAVGESFPSKEVCRTACKATNVNMVTFVNSRKFQDAMFKVTVTVRLFSKIVATSSTISSLSTGLKRTNECERNNGRLATFRYMKEYEPRIAAQLNQGMKYWIGLNRYEWRWIDSGKLISYTNFGTLYTFHGHSYLTLDIGSRKLLVRKNCTKELHKFICIRDTTKSASNPCRNGERCVGSIHNHSCECIAGRQCRTVVNKCDSNPCRNGGTCYDDVNYYMCQCVSGYTGEECQINTNECNSNPCKNGGPGLTGSQYQTCSTQETPASDMTKIVIVQAVVIIIISTILVVVCIRKRNKTRKSNDAELATRYETRNTSVLDSHIYSDINRYANIGADERQPAGQESSIYEQIV